MIHDPSLLDRLSEFHSERFEGEVFRATRTSADPVAASISGGRWAPPPDGEAGHFVLYTSLERDGAIAEVASFLAQLTPIPGPRPMKITRLAVSTARTIRLHVSILVRSTWIWRAMGSGTTTERRRSARPLSFSVSTASSPLGPMVVRQPHDIRRQSRVDRNARGSGRRTRRVATVGTDPRNPCRCVERW